MEIKLNRNDALIIKTDEGELNINSNQGKVSFTGDTTYKNMDELEYNKLLDSLKEKGSFWGKDDAEKETEWQKLRAKIDELVVFASEYLKIDKSYTLQALEKKRDYSINNYYEHVSYNKIKDGIELAKKISELNETLYQQKKDFDKERIELQKKITDAQGFRTAVTLVKTSLEVSGTVDLWVNCPHCTKFQEIDSSDYDYDGDFETNHECESCGKWFSVEAEK